MVGNTCQQSSNYTVMSMMYATWVHKVLHCYSIVHNMAYYVINSAKSSLRNHAQSETNTTTNYIAHFHFAQLRIGTRISMQLKAAPVTHATNVPGRPCSLCCQQTHSFGSVYVVCFDIWPCVQNWCYIHTDEMIADKQNKNRLYVHCALCSWPG